MNNENEGKRIALYVTNDILEICEQDIEKANAKNRSHFICKAVKFYHCYINKDLTDSVLTPAFERVVDARLNLTEDRLAQIIFKLACAFELDPDKVDRMKYRVQHEVKAINGSIDLEEIIRYQNGD